MCSYTYPCHNTACTMFDRWRGMICDISFTFPVILGLVNLVPELFIFLAKSLDSSFWRWCLSYCAKVLGTCKLLKPLHSTVHCVLDLTRCCKSVFLHQLIKIIYFSLPWSSRPSVFTEHISGFLLIRNGPGCWFGHFKFLLSLLGLFF